MLPSSLAAAEAEADASEHNLIAAAQLGDTEAFGVLFERSKNAVYSFVLRSVGSREDAEDIVQEVFCRAWRSLAAFRGECALLTWLYKIAANLCADYARSAQRRPRAAMSDPDMRDIEADSRLASHIASRSIIRYALDDALNSLPLSHRMLVVLCDIHGFTCKEAARILGCSSVSARVRLSRARRRLRELLSDVLGEAE